MKKLIVPIILICFISFANAQVKAPENVKSTFQKMFPGAEKLKWHKEKNGDFEADFLWKNEKHSANFSQTGDWLETESTIDFETLPENVKMTFRSKHDQLKIKSVSRIDKSDGTIEYEIELRLKTKTIELFYDLNGEEIKK